MSKFSIYIVSCLLVFSLLTNLSLLDVLLMVYLDSVNRHEPLCLVLSMLDTALSFSLSSKKPFLIISVSAFCVVTINGYLVHGGCTPE